MTTPEPSGLVMLSEEECWRRLRGQDLGRLGVVIEGRPQIFPVNYEVVQKVVLFRSGVGVKLDAAKLGPVCFEIDHWDRRAERGWSVMVQGTAREVRDLRDPLWPAVQGQSPRPAAPGIRTHAVAVHVDRISGRHFGHRDPAKAAV